jgi:hypothetical protein
MAKRLVERAQKYFVIPTKVGIVGIEGEIPTFVGMTTLLLLLSQLH